MLLQFFNSAVIANSKLDYSIPQFFSVPLPLHSLLLLSLHSLFPLYFLSTRQAHIINNFHNATEFANNFLFFVVFKFYHTNDSTRFLS